MIYYGTGTMNHYWVFIRNLLKYLQDTHGPRTIIFIEDGAKIHDNISISMLFRQNKNYVRLGAPSYTPQVCPIELTYSCLKKKWYKANPDTTNVERCIVETYQTFTPEKVKKFWVRTLEFHGKNIGLHQF
jgi:transposase